MMFSYGWKGLYPNSNSYNKYMNTIEEYTVNEWERINLFIWNYGIFRGIMDLELGPKFELCIYETKSTIPTKIPIPTKNHSIRKTQPRRKSIYLSAKSRFIMNDMETEEKKTVPNNPKHKNSMCVCYWDDISDIWFRMRHFWFCIFRMNLGIIPANQKLLRSI